MDMSTGSLVALIVTGALLAALPAILVLQQIVTVRARRQTLVDGLGGTTKSGGAPRLAAATSLIVTRVTQSPNALEYLGPSLLLLLLGLGAEFLLFGGLAVTGFGYANSMSTGGYTAFDAAMRGLRYGSVGAYLSLVLGLGRRALRRDVSLGQAWWCVATLVAGPVMGAVVALVCSISDDGKSWTAAALYFVAGLSPKQAADWVWSAVRRLYMTTDADGATSRPAPLGQLRGITLDTIERLQEERIDDLVTMAMSDPIRLLDNTAYSLRQIVYWVDEALLMVYAPDSWGALQEAGISGAIDLAWTFETAPNSFGVLAGAAGMDETLLRNLAQRLAEDGQVQQIWALYQVGSGDT